MFAAKSVVKNGFQATKIADDMAWAVGAITPQIAAVDDDLLTAVLANIVPVDPLQQQYAACTDGRLPVRLLDGSVVPVREQMVGADIVSAFYVAEALGPRFYKDPSAPVAERVLDVARFLHENGSLPSTHVGCGAAAGFLSVIDNVSRFHADDQFVARQQALLPRGVYDEGLHAEMLAALAKRLESGAYDGLTADTFVEAVLLVSGKQAIAELKDDGRGIHGHVEEAVVRIQTPHVALDTAGLARQTNGREVFCVNDARMEATGRLFGRGTDTDYRIALMALEDFADAGHGTLAKNLPTYVVGKA